MDGPLGVFATIQHYFVFKAKGARLNFDSCADPVIHVEKVMRAILQRVTSASVAVDGTTISAIGKGLLILVGISRNDTEKDMEYLIRKILNLRLWDDEEKGKRWMKSVSVQKYELKGNAPDFHHAMPAEDSKQFFDTFVEQLKAAYSPELVQTGKFGHKMKVNMEGDGPVTIHLESPAKEAKAQKSSSKQTDSHPTEVVADQSSVS